MKITSIKTATVIGIILLIVSISQFMQCTNSTNAQPPKTTGENEDPIMDNANKMLAEGKQTFRFETFGDEAYWSASLQLDKAIEGQKMVALAQGYLPKLHWQQD